MFVRAARISHESQTTKFSVHVILVAVARSSSGDDAIPCIGPPTSGFVDDVMCANDRLGKGDASRASTK